MHTWHTSKRESPRTRGPMSGMASAACLWAGFALPAGDAAAQRVIELPLEDRTLTADFPEVYRVGDRGREWELFSSLTSVGFDARGRLHIADLVGDELRVVVVDSTGARVSEFGRRGDGPGEFRAVKQAFALADGRTVVPDQAHFAYHIFAPDGEFERMVRFEGVGPAHDLPAAMTPSANPRSYRSDYRGGLLSRVTFVWQVETEADGRPADVNVVSGPHAVDRMIFDGEEARTAPIVGAAASRPERDSDGGSLARFLFAPLPGGSVVLLDSTAYALRIVAPGEGVRRVLSRPLPARGWNDRNRRAFLGQVAARAREEVERGGAAAAMVGLMGGAGGFESWLDETKLRGEIEAVEALETTWEGKIWVLRTPAAGFPDYDLLAEAMSAFTGSPPGLQPRRPGLIDILTPEGGYVGTLTEAEMPAAFGPAGLVAYVHLDEFDVPTVIVRRVPEAMRE